jgi:hypothetical protein
MVRVATAALAVQALSHQELQAGVDLVLQVRGEAEAAGAVETWPLGVWSVRVDKAARVETATCASPGKMRCRLLRLFHD